MWTFRAVKNTAQKELINFLKTVNYFKSLPEHSIAELANEFEAIYFPSGETIIREGDPGDSLYGVQTGRLLVLKRTDDIGAEEQIIGEVERGELVGELALFTDAPRAATILAIRDSVLWRLSKDSFDDFVKKNAMHIMPMVRSAILKLLGPKKLKKQSFRVLAIAPAGRYPLNSNFIHVLVEHLSFHAPTLLINSDLIKNQFTNLRTEGANGIELIDPMVIAWLNEQEQKYTYALYETDAINTEWTRLCLRQADKILLIGDAEDDPRLGSIEQYLFGAIKNIHPSPIELVLLQKANTVIPIHTAEWLTERTGVKVHHVKKESERSLKRLVRLITGKGIAVVLGGGGAKAMAHFGVYKALLELNIPVDYVGGTSMGAIIGAVIAMDMSAQEAIELFETNVIKNKKFNDYTVPIISFLRGGGWLKALKQALGEHVCIEDLWKTFFCVASNFTLRKVEVLTHGSLYKAVRASASLPGLLPPISNEAHELLIDGGIFNNLPVDIMREMFSPGELIAVRVSPISDIHAEIPDGVASGFQRYMSRFGKESLQRIGQVPTISEIIAGCITLCNDEKESIQFASASHALDINLGQCGILDVSKLSQAVDQGYRAAMEQFQNWPIDKLI